MGIGHLGNSFAPVCHSIHGGGACSRGGVPAPGGSVWSWGMPALWGSDPGGVCAPGPHERGKLRGIRSRPTPKEKKLRGIRSRPTPKGKLRGIRSRPTSKGDIEGDQMQPPPNDYCCRRYASYWNAFLFSSVSANSTSTDS